MNVGMMACYDQAKGTMMSVSTIRQAEMQMERRWSTRLSLADPSRSHPLTPGRGIVAHLTFFVH